MKVAECPLNQIAQADFNVALASAAPPSPAWRPRLRFRVMRHTHESAGQAEPERGGPYLRNARLAFGWNSGSPN